MDRHWTTGFVLFLCVLCLGWAFGYEPETPEVDLAPVFASEPDPVESGMECTITNSWQMTDANRRWVVIYVCDEFQQQQ